VRIALALALIAAASADAAQEAPRGVARPLRFASSVEATSVVRGRVTSITGGVIRGAEVRAREVNGREARLVTTDDTGGYEIRNLLPGSYNVTASKTGFITQVLQPETAARVGAAHQHRRAAGRAGELHAWAVPAPSADACSTSSAIRWPARMAPDGWMLKAVEVDNTDMTDRVLNLRGASHDVRVVLTDRVTQLDGSVTGDSRPAPDVDVVVFPDDPALWAFPARHVRALKTAADGTFRVRGLPPHQSYFAVAVDYLDDGETQDPEFLEGLRDKATRFSIDYGESRSLALRVVERR